MYAQTLNKYTRCTLFCNFPTALRTNCIAAMSYVIDDFEHINMILKNRLEGLSVFGDKGMELMARKAAATAGDLRAALKICQR